MSFTTNWPAFIVFACPHALAPAAEPAAAGFIDNGAHAAKPPGDSGAQKRERESLQDFLARLKVQRDQLLSEMRGSVDALLRTLEVEAQTRRIEGLQEAKARLVALGPEVAPLLVDGIDPGVNANDAGRLKSTYVTMALCELGSRAITSRLIALADSGSPEGKLNAIKVLAATPDPARVGPALVALYRASQGELRAAALCALAKIGGPENEKIVVEALADPSPEVVKSTLQALANAHAVASAPKVLRLLEVTHDAVQYVDALLLYYRAIPEAADKNHIAGLIALAGDFSASNEQRIRILEFLSTFGDKIDN